MQYVRHYEEPTGGGLATKMNSDLNQMNDGAKVVKIQKTAYAENSYLVVYDVPSEDELYGDPASTR